MHAPPADLSVSELRTALVSGWRIEPSSIAYAPVGFGSHHWTVVEPSSRRWFVTADAVTDSSTRLADLSAALRTAFTPRRDAGLEFIVARVQPLDHQQRTGHDRLEHRSARAAGARPLDDRRTSALHRTHQATAASPTAQLLPLRWDLADLCSYGAWFCGPHQATPDTQLGWQEAVAICGVCPLALRARTWLSKLNRRSSHAPDREGLPVSRTLSETTNSQM